MSDKKLRFALFGNEYQAKKSASIQKILSCLSEREATVCIDRAFYEFLTQTEHLKIEGAQVFEGTAFDADFVISMGGDGTFLKAASRVGDKQIPIIGVNMGRLGFLADVLPSEIESMLEDLFLGRFTIEDHAVLQIEVTYQADGLIVSTPTGSTAYSLSNGGPVIVPQSGNLCLTPVAPHSLNIRPIVISDDAVVTMTVESRSHNYLVAVDGRSEKLQEDTKITIRRAPYTVRVVKKKGKRYFSTLREKMMWGSDMRN